MQHDFEKLVDALKAADVGAVAADVPMAPYTAYRIGGKAAVWVAPANSAQAGRALEIIDTHAVKLFVMGRGSNLLVSDQGWPGAVLYLGDNLSGWTVDQGDVTVLAGTKLIDLIRDVTDRGLGGMEQMAGIPGSVGGAWCMNAGAFGQEIGPVTASVSGFTLEGKPVTLSHGGIGFGYRAAPGLKGLVLTEGQIQLKPGSPAILKSHLDTILGKRAEKQPLNLPSCGSVFKRPTGHYAGALIEAAGLKGETRGQAMISPKHAGFIVNLGGATAADVFGLIRYIEDRIFARFSVRLEREVKLVGAFDAP